MKEYGIHEQITVVAMLAVLLYYGKYWDRARFVECLRAEWMGRDAIIRGRVHG